MVTMDMLEQDNYYDTTPTTTLLIPSSPSGQVFCFCFWMERLFLKQPIMRIEDRLFDRGWARSAMATRKCGNIYFRKYFMAVRKFTNIFLPLLILMVGSRDTLFLVCFT